MPEDLVERRLAAILAADVVGYSRLMEKDEEGTLATLTGHRKELIEPCVADHRGRVVKTTGDGLLVEFSSVVDAVRCAIALQDGILQRNTVEPAALLGDKGYDSDGFIEVLEMRAIKPVIPPKANRRVKRNCDFALYCERNLVERFFNAIKHFRGIATRYEKTARNYLAGLHMVCALAWFNDTP